VPQTFAIADAISIRTVSTAIEAQAKTAQRFLFGVAQAPSADTARSLDGAHVAVATSANAPESALTVIDDFYEQLRGRVLSSSRGNVGHAAPSDPGGVSDDYYEQLSLELLSS
jgi:hypothetical protein